MLFANTNPAVLEACTLCRHKTWKSAFRRQCHICCEVFSRLLWGRCYAVFTQLTSYLHLKFHSCSESRYDYVCSSRLARICIDWFLNFMTFLFKGFLPVSVLVVDSLGIISNLDCYLYQSSCFALRLSLVGLVVKISLVFLYLILLILQACLFHVGHQMKIRLSHQEVRSQLSWSASANVTTFTELFRLPIFGAVSYFQKLCSVVVVKWEI